MLDRVLELLSACWHRLVPFYVVNQYQRAIVLRLGVFRRELGPGFHWVWPLLEWVLDHDVVPRVHKLQPQSVTTRDGQSCVLQPVITWRVSDVRKLLLEVEDADHAIRDAAQGSIATRVANSTWDEVIAPGFLDEAQKDMRRRAFRWGIEIMQVQFVDIQRCKSLRLWQEHEYK